MESSSWLAQTTLNSPRWPLSVCLSVLAPDYTDLLNGRGSLASGMVWQMLQPDGADQQCEPQSLGPEQGSFWIPAAFLEKKTRDNLARSLSFQTNFYLFLFLGFYFSLPVFFLTSNPILKPSSMNSTTCTKSASLNCLEVRAGAPGTQNTQAFSIKSSTQAFSIKSIITYPCYQRSMYCRLRKLWFKFFSTHLQ